MKQIGLRGLGTALPERFAPLAELTLVSPTERLVGFGFEGAWVAEDTAELATRAARSALADSDLAPGDIDILLVA
jgi:3-oxoacyl-[acyl-carrier-protein] synthase III